MHPLPSRFRRYCQVIGWTLIIAVVYLSLTPTPPELPMEGGDRFEHALAYATLMFWFAHLHERLPQRLAWVLGFIGMGIGLEYLQQLTGYRSFQVGDMVADAVGVGIGWLASPPRVPNALRMIEARWPRNW